MPDIALDDLTPWRWSFLVRRHSPNRPDDLDKYEAEFCAARAFPDAPAPDSFRDTHAFLRSLKTMPKGGSENGDG